MKYNLGRTYYIEPAVCVNGAEGSEGFHHGLLICLCMINPVNDNIAGVQHLVHISVFADLVCTEVPFVIGSHRAQGFPVILRVHKDIIVKGFMEIQNRLKDFVFHFY